MIDTKRLAASLLGTVRDWVEPAFKLMGERLDAFDARLQAIPAGPKGDPGEIGPVGAAGLSIRGDPGEPGKDAEPIHPDTVARLVADAVRMAVKELPVPKDGKDGASADPVFVEKLVHAAVTSAVAAIDKPADGINGKDGRDADPEFIRAEIAKAVAAIPLAHDGKDADASEIFNALRIELDGSMAKIQLPKDGERGADGADADPAVIRASVDEAVSGVNREFLDMADELLRGLEDATAEQTAAAPSINVHVNAGSDSGSKVRNIGSLTREQTVIGTMIADTIRETLMLPVKPVYDAKGNLLYGQRVKDVEAA
jgi:hypothetical protein